MPAFNSEAPEIKLQFTNHFNSLISIFTYKTHFYREHCES